MAINTRSRRASVLGVTGAILLTLPLADGAIGQEDRQHLPFTYAGIAATVPTVITAPYWQSLLLEPESLRLRLDHETTKLLLTPEGTRIRHRRDA